jgi:hypothetical protein
MSAQSIEQPYPIFTDADGAPLEAGYIWIGVENLNAITDPVAVYWDAALTQPAVQPIRTAGGYPVNAGTPARLYTLAAYSILVQDRNGVTVYSSASGNTDIDIILGVGQWLTVTGVDTIVGSSSVSAGAYAAGQTFRFVAAATNTGAVTLNVNGLGPKAITKEGTTALVAGDIVSGQVVNVTYDGTRFQLVAGLRPALGTPVATTSGTTIDLTGLSATARRVVLAFNGVSTNGANQPLIQLGTSGGVQTTGYSTVTTSITTGANAATAYTNGWQLFSAGPGNVLYGAITFTLVDTASGTWAATGTVASNTTPSVISLAGAKSLSGVLDRIRLTTVGGTDAFDAGSVNVLMD